MNRPQVAYFLSGVLVYFPSGARITIGAAQQVAWSSFCDASSGASGLAAGVSEAGPPPA